MNTELQILLFHLSCDLRPQLTRPFGIGQSGQFLALKEVRGDPAVEANRWASKTVFRRVRGQAGEEAEHAVDGRLRCCPEIEAVASLRGNIAGIPGVERHVAVGARDGTSYLGRPLIRSVMVDPAIDDETVSTTKSRFSRQEPKRMTDPRSR